MKNILKKLKRFCRSVLSVSELVLWHVIARHQQNLGSGEIVVIQDCHVGDFMVSLPFFQRMKEFYGRKMVLVSDKRIVPLAMACGCFERVIAFDMLRASSYKHIFYRWQCLRALRKIQAAVLLQKYSVGGTALEDCMALVISAHEKIGVDSLKTESNGGCRFYGKLLRKNFDRMYKYDEEKNLLENENAFCNMVCRGNECDCVGDMECFEPLPEKDQSWGDYALFIVGADDPRRRWETEKFAAVAEKYLQTNPENKVLFSGSPAEQKIIQDVLQNIPEDLHIRIKVRAVESDYLQAIKRLMSDCKHASFVLTGETGPLHIAAKFKTRCYCLSGGWHYKVWAPWSEYPNTTYFQAECPCGNYGCFGVCKYKTIPFKCLQELSAEKVCEMLHMR